MLKIHKWELIETLWNVNLHQSLLILFLQNELIETLWNVNPAKGEGKKEEYLN